MATPSACSLVNVNFPACLPVNAATAAADVADDVHGNHDDDDDDNCVGMQVVFAYVLNCCCAAALNVLSVLLPAFSPWTLDFGARPGHGDAAAAAAATDPACQAG